MSDSDLVQWIEWTGTDGLLHAMTVEDFQIWNVLWPGEIQVKDRKATTRWLPKGKFSKNWEVPQYDADRVQPRGTKTKFEGRETKEKADLLPAEAVA